MKNVLVEFEFPGMTTREYDQIWKDLKKEGYSNPKGLIYHLGAPTKNGIKVVDTWENVEKFNEFGKTLMPILAKNGVKSTQPTISPLHNIFSAKEDLAHH